MRLLAKYKKQDAAKCYKTIIPNFHQSFIILFCFFKILFFLIKQVLAPIKSLLFLFQLRYFIIFHKSSQQLLATNKRIKLNSLNFLFITMSNFVNFFLFARSVVQFKFILSFLSSSLRLLFPSP